MTASPDDVLSLAIFARVVEANSFTAAAQRLGLSKSAVSARVSQLEERLGMRLLHRTTRRLSLTGPGLALYERAARVVSAADEASALAAGEAPEPHGLLRVSAPLAFAQLHMTAPMATFMAKHPGVRVELLPSDRMVDLVQEGIDVAIRLSARMRDSSLVARKLAEDRTVVCASPAYLSRRGTPQMPADLLQHDILRYSLLKLEDEWRFKSGGPSYSVPLEPRFEASSGVMVREAALEGIGIAVLPSFMVAQEIGAGRLRQVLAEHSFIRMAMHAVYPSARGVPASVRAFVETLAAHLRVPPWTRVNPTDVAQKRGKRARAGS